MSPKSATQTASLRNGLYVVAVLLLPLLVLWHRDNVLYSPPLRTDPWFYLGYFKDLVDFKRDLFPSFHGGSRYSWILPGYLVHSLFSPVTANFILHLAVHSIAVLSLFSILRVTAGVRAAFLTAMVFSLHPWLWAATGWDYIDGPGVAYCLLALALLTRSARQPVRRGSLLWAGVALAGMLYSNLSWITIAPLLPLYYIAMVWAWHRTPMIRSLAAVCLWSGAGFGIVTVAFSGVNYLLDGSFWYLRTTIETARSLAANWRYSTSIWENGRLGPWLWFGVVAGIAAVLLLPSRLRKGAIRHTAAGVLFSALLFVTVAFMAYQQYRGIAVLGQYFYASHLLPFVFLVIGTSFWPAAEAMPPRAYVLTCCATAVVFGAIWYHAEQWRLPARETALAGAGALAMALVLRRRQTGTLLAMAGFAVLTAGVVTEAVRLHGTRAEYERVMHARERIESVRHGGAVWFWFNESDPDSPDYFALNNTYMAESRRLGTAFPQYGCDVKLETGALVVVSSRDGRAPETASGVLRDCWHAYGMKPVVEEVDHFQPGGRPYAVAMIGAEADSSLRHSLRPVFDSTGKASLQIVEESDAPVAFPPERWVPLQHQTDNGAMQITPGGIAVLTPRGPYAYAIGYPPLVVPVTGRYRFALQYSHRSGQFCFGARPADDSRYLATDAVGHREGNAREMCFWLDLKRGETVRLLVANNNNFGVGAASFLIEKLSAIEVDQQPDPALNASTPVLQQESSGSTRRN
jgi:hypothetical protein